MKRRPVGRDLGLSARMAIALGFLAATYVGLVLGFAGVLLLLPQFALYWVVVGFALVVTFVAHYETATSFLLGAVGARLLEPDERPHLHQQVERLATLAGIPPPRIAFADTESPNAFAVGLTRRHAVVVVTAGLCHRLHPEELEAVLAHEVAHLAHRDAAVMTAVAVPRRFGEVVVGRSATDLLGLVWLVVWPLGLIPLGLGTALTLTMSRYREFAADRGGALLTGAPEQLMSALQRLTDDAIAMPHGDLRAANAFCIVSTQAHPFRLFADHPPLDARLAALAEIAREMGRPVS